jgi:kynurenine formamidase
MINLITSAVILAVPTLERKAQADPGVAPRAGATDKVLDCLASNRLNVIDLTHVINAKTPDFFGDKDVYRFSHTTSVRKDGYSTGAFQTPEHFGTHIDAPVHFVQGAPTVDGIPATRLVLPAVVIDVRKQVEKNPDFLLTFPMVQEWENQHGNIPSNAAVLLLSGWAQYWDSEKQYRNPDAKQQMHFPGYSPEAAKYLIEERNAVALGIDTLSIDPGQSQTYPVHKIAGRHNVFLIENLNNLDKLPNRGILLFCGPLALEGGSGCPARVLAIVDRPE